MKKVKVSAEACIGCGACVAIDPEHFEFNDEGLSQAINQENLESLELQNAIESCPTSAIAIHEEIETCECDTCESDSMCKCSCEDECNCECDEKCDCNDECSCDNECNCNNCNCSQE